MLTAKEALKKARANAKEYICAPSIVETQKIENNISDLVSRGGTCAVFDDLSGDMVTYLKKAGYFVKWYNNGDGDGSGHYEVKWDEASLEKAIPPKQIK
ncbi:MAG: hypothetical protein FWE47_04210 [Oscillospiraceae bacterium]|nr:hypothetical protein [Oscillospiraceae bacterium]